MEASVYDVDRYARRDVALWVVHVIQHVTVTQLDKVMLLTQEAFSQRLARSIILNDLQLEVQHL
jgi:hypothetical protein